MAVQFVKYLHRDMKQRTTLLRRSTPPFLPSINELIKKGKAANIISDTNLRVPID